MQTNPTNNHKQTQRGSAEKGPRPYQSNKEAIIINYNISKITRRELFLQKTTTKGTLENPIRFFDH